MLKNYLKIAGRNLLRYKGYATINILGLAIGMACCILIVLFVQNELSYDNFHEKANRIYRVAGDMKFGGNHFELAVAPAPMAEALERDYPEVLKAARFRNQGTFLVKKDVQNFKEDRIAFADNGVFDIFTISFIEGDATTALDKPNSVVITRTISEKYFADASALGQTLIFDDTDAYTVTGVVEDLPDNSHFHLDFFLSMVSLDESRNNMWVSNNFHTYLLLHEDADAGALEGKFPAMIVKYMGPQVKELLGIGLEEFAKGGNKVRYYLQPLSDIHLHSDLTAELAPNGSIYHVYVFSAIAFFILIIACVNFMNLSTARSAKRAKEVGIRKVVGSYRRQLIGQFLTESVFLSLAALFLALGLVELALPKFNSLANKHLVTDYSGNWPLLGTLLVITLVVGVAAGSYPALVLSGFKPVSVLKGSLQKSSRAGWLRSSLVVFQFATSVILIIATLIVGNQLDYIQNKKLGFDKEQVVIVHDVYALGSQLAAFKNEILRHPQVINGTVSSYLPVSSNRSDTGFWPEGKRSEQDAVSMQIWPVDHDYFSTMGMEIAEGRDFSRQFSTDSSAIIINEQAAQLFGFDDPIGKNVYTFAFDPGKGMDPNKTIAYTIVGVVKNFHFESLKENIGALGLRLGERGSLASFRFQVENTEELIGFLETKWKEFSPNQPFDYSFMSQRFANMYHSEQKVEDIFRLFSGLAIFTACLGLFGLASFTAEQRTKEIGIRKVLGASTSGIVVLFSREFARFVLIAGVVAAPIAWVVMRQWLNNFVYRTDLNAGVFLLAIGISLAIAILTVSYQSIRAALTNPTDALHYE